MVRWYSFMAIVFMTFAIPRGSMAQTEQPIDSLLVNPSLNPDEATPDEDSTIYKPKSPPDTKYYEHPLERHDFKPEDWKKATQGIEYSIKKRKRAQRSRESSNLDLSGLSGLLNALKYFVILLFGGLIVYLIVRLVSEGNIFKPNSRKINPLSEGIDITQIEENLEHTDLEGFIRRAIEQKNYPLAIRLYYLAIIKELSAHGAIQWKKDKTNRAYINEMEANRLFEPFKKTTRIFERVWYGDTPFGEQDFAVVRPDFERLLQHVKGK